MDDIHPRHLENAIKSISPNKIKILSLTHKTPNIINKIKQNNTIAIILSGSKYRILHENSPTLPPSIIKLNIPILGICYGFQWLIKITKGGICTHEDNKLHEYGKRLTIYNKTNTYLFKHNDYICNLNESKWIPHIYDETHNQIWMATHKTLPLTGIQFHPEKKEASAKTFFSNWIAKNTE
jgi:GMP synthase (glutamine-hydrolysing)